MSQVSTPGHGLHSMSWKKTGWKWYLVVLISWKCKLLQILPAIFVYKQCKHVHSLKQSSKLIKSQTYRAKIATKIARVHSPLKNFEYPTRFEPRTYRGRVARSEQQTTVQRNSGQNQSFTMFTCYTRPTLCFAYLPLCVFHKKNETRVSKMSV